MDTPDLMDQHIERETVDAFHVHYLCKCGYCSGATVWGLGRGTSSARWGLLVEAAVRDAEEVASANAVSNADVILALTPCPRCGQSSGVVRRQLRPVLFSVALTICSGGLAHAFLPGASAPVVVVAVLVMLVLLVRWWFVGDPRSDAQQRVAFHDRPRGTQTVRIPVPLRPNAAMGSTLMVVFGLTSLLFATSEAPFFQRQFQSVSMPCETTATWHVRAKTWVEIEACPIAYQRFEVVESGASPTIYLPVGFSTEASPVAWLELRDADAKAFLSDPSSAERQRRFTPVDGLLRSDAWGQDGSRAQVVDPNPPPRLDVWTATLAALVLLVAGAVYWPRRTWTLTVV